MNKYTEKWLNQNRDSHFGFVRFNNVFYMLSISNFSSYWRIWSHAFLVS